MTRALLRVFVCAPSVFPISAYTEQPVESSSDETRSASRRELKALPLPW